VPPEPDRLVADLDTALVQQILDVPNDYGNRTYSITAMRVISGLVLNDLTGLGCKATDPPAPPQAGFF
jgi:hypothetical protein